MNDLLLLFFAFLLRGVIEEAEFYNITGIIDKIKSRQKEREDNLNNVKHFDILSLSVFYGYFQTAVRSVYRVLQCSEEELTRTISSMSDGWKFEQVIVILR